MTRLLTTLFAAGSAIILIGCDHESQRAAVVNSRLPEGYVAPAPTNNLPLVDHPEYANWSQFPVGTVVTRKKEVSNEFGIVKVTTTVRLAEKTADKVVVESQVTVDRRGSELVENPPFTAEFAAKFHLPAGMNREQFSLPSLKAKQIGDEVREACGSEFQTQVFAWEERNEAGPMAVKLWRSDNVPGRMLRQEIEGHNHHSVEEVVEIVRPEA